MASMASMVSCGFLDDGDALEFDHRLLDAGVEVGVDAAEDAGEEVAPSSMVFAVTGLLLRAARRR